MLKKQLLLVVTVVFLTISCASDDDSRDNYPQNKNISFTVTSSDNNRQSDITLAIQGKGIDVSDFSSSESHLPFTKDYLNQTMAFLTTLDITYRDNSGGGVPFEPYTIKLKISTDSEALTEKEITITKSGTTDFVDFTFN